MHGDNGLSVRACASLLLLCCTLLIPLLVVCMCIAVGAYASLTLGLTY
jgi:hypothetical protein